MVGQLTLDQPVVVRIHVPEPSRTFLHVAVRLSAYGLFYFIAHSIAHSIKTPSFNAHFTDQAAEMAQYAAYSEGNCHTSELSWLKLECINSNFCSAACLACDISEFNEALCPALKIVGTERDPRIEVC